MAPVGSIAEIADRIGVVAPQHLLGAFRSAFSKDISGDVTIKPGYVRVATGAPHPFGNFVIGLGPDDATGIQEAVTSLTEIAAPSLVMYPHPEVTTDVATKLTELGFQFVGAMPAMAVDLDQLAETTLADGYACVEVGPELTPEAWIDCLAKGYEIPQRVAELFNPAAADPSFRYFGAVKDGRVDSVSTVCLSGGVAGIYCVATRPEARGKGFGAHMTAEPLRLAAKDGYRVGVLQSSEMGYPIYKRLGFGDFGHVQMFMRMPS